LFSGSEPAHHRFGVGFIFHPLNLSFHALFSHDVALSEIKAIDSQIFFGYPFNATAPRLVGVGGAIRSAGSLSIRHILISF
jgi:hypothetical protein